MQLPEAFERNMRELLGAGADSVLAAIADEPVVSVRLNPWKRVPTGLEDAVPWAADAFYLDERKAFTFDPLFHAGCYYVQEASSMFLEQAVRAYVTKPVVALDLCAAPGGKSTLLRATLPQGSVLVANEPMANRAQVLVENIVKWGHRDCVVTSGFPADFGALGETFDLLVTDIPCSGEGMFRKDPVAVADWSEENVDVCWRRGRDILRDCWPCLRPGGLLVYSTCTFNPYEDEKNVRWICDELGAEVLPIDIDERWGITGDLTSNDGDTPLPVYHFLPGRTRGEGFFLAVLRKHGTTDDAPSGPAPTVKSLRKARSRQTEKTLPVPAICRSWIRRTDDCMWAVNGTTVEAIPRSLNDETGLLTALRQQMRVLHAGIRVAELKGRDVVPIQALAFSTECNMEAFASVPLAYADALQYLRGESLTLPADTPRGFVLLTFKGMPIGFAKNLGNRANNLYPAEWRIRTTHLPSEPVEVLYF